MEKAINFIEKNYRGYENFSSDTSQIYTSIKNEYNKLRENDPNFQYYGNVGFYTGCNISIITIEGDKAIGTIISNDYPWFKPKKGDVAQITQ